MYDRILLATDGSTASENAADHAVELAAEQGAVLHVLSVVDEDVYGAYSGDEFVSESEGPEHTLEAHARDVVADVADEAEAEGVVVETAVEHGDPAETVVAYADDHDVDLLVLGTRHRSEEYRALLGSVTDKVLRLTARPATVVKTQTEE